MTAKKKKRKPKDKIDLLEVYQSIRKLWIRNPKTQVVPNKKKKNNRSKVKQQLKKETR